MKRLIFNSRKWIAASVTIFAAMVAFVACNKPFPDTLEKEYFEEPVKAIERKILLILVDGAVGSEVRAAMPPTLNSLVDFSIFSWDGLNEYRNNQVTNPLSWSTLLTGANSNKHNVTGNDFSTYAIASYPSIFTRLKQEKPNLRTAAFSASADLATNLAADASVKNNFTGNDAAVKEAAKEELLSNDPDLIMAQFIGVDKAGESTSYSINSAEYKSAILQVDSYIGELLAAMRARPNYESENWMVIITSNKGSNEQYVPVGTPWSAFDDKSHNTFFFFYNPRFKSQNPNKPTVIPYFGASPYYSGTQSLNRRAKVLDGGDSYDIGATGSFTIQCKVKIPAGNYYYPAFLSKRASFGGGVVGWVFFMEGNYWQINFGQSGFGNRQIRGHAIADGQWHTLTVVIKQEGSARNVYTYTDGVLYPFTGNRDIASYGNLNSPQPLTVGNLPPDNVTNFQNYLVTDIRFYNTALSTDYILNNYCKTDVETTDPYKTNLKGFWPSTSVTLDKKLLDESGNGHHLVIESYNPASFADITTSVCPAVSDAVYKTVPNAADVAMQIYQWFGVIVPPTWNLDGKNWIPAYSDLGG